MSFSATTVEQPPPHTFRFDRPIEPRIFGDEYNLSGWLLHPEGKPINGIRAVVKRALTDRKIFPARRKRERPDVAAAFPDLPDAKASGFLLELQLKLGRNHLTLQVLDHDRIWRTFQTATIWAFPLSLLKRLRFLNLRRFVISYLQQNYSEKRAWLNRSPPETTFSLPTPERIVGSTKYVDLFATSKSNLFILEIGELIAAGFRELGCSAQMHIDQIPSADPKPGTTQLVITPHEFYNLFLTEKISQDEARCLTRNLALLCTEQPETGWFYSNLQWAAHARATFDINPLGVIGYHARDIPCQHFQLGYHPMLGASERTPYTHRRYEITFLGSMTPRRDEFFAEHAPFFAQHRCHVRFVPLGFAKTKVTRSYLSSERRNELLSRSKIFLNLHYSERKYFEWHRSLVGLANGCCVISETSRGYGDLVPGKHFIMADAQDLIGCCDYYLNHPDEAGQIAQTGLEFVQNHLRQSQTCQRFLQALESSSQRDATADFPHLALHDDAAPVSLPRELVRTFSRRKLQLLKRALAHDFHAMLDRSRTADIPSELEDVSRQRSFIIEKREAYKARWSEQEMWRSQGKAAWQFHDNQGYRASAQPKVSVVITLFNYGHYIEECVASISRAAEKMSAPIEIVIVNDASVDDSLSQAMRCQSLSNLPVRIVDKNFNTGLADARNVGVEMARAPYVLMMDADNLLFPNGLRELVETIEHDDCAAAYTLLCRFRGSPSNRVGLLSQYDWDPQILVQHPYVDAMALFRRDALLNLGGYDNHLNQIGWFGWEDYDMWLRFAQNNYAVGFVPNILCLYRYHDTSMINVTNLFESELVHHFLERFGELVGRFEPRETLFGIERTKIAGTISEPARIGEQPVSAF
jgi:glycosyltransferase involved in cell wall biosynthesis